MEGDQPELSDLEKAILDQYIAGKEAPEIAALAGTTLNNVYKTKSKLKSLGLLPPRGKIQKQNDVLNAPSIQGKATSPGTIHLSQGSQQLTPEQMKIMYKEFQKGSKPYHIIEEHGFAPAIVELEYERYLKFTNHDGQTLQSEFINNCIRDMFKEGDIKALIDKFVQSG